MIPVHTLLEPSITTQCATKRSNAPLLTIVDLEHFPTDDGNRYELIDGVLYVATQPHWRHQNIATNLSGELWFWNRQTGAGKVLVEPGIIFASDTAIIPDIVWIHRDRLAIVLDEDGKLHAAPDLAVEILSAGKENQTRDREKKRVLYERYGVQEYWIVDRWQRQIEVYRLVNGQLALTHTYGVADTLTSPLLLGFACSVASVLDED